jgi:HK97 family phage portal protein
MIVRTRSGANMELRASNTWGPPAIPPPPWGGMDMGMYGGPDRAAGIPAVLNAVWTIAETTGSLPLQVWKGQLANKRLQDSSWQWKLLGEDPNGEQSPFNFWFDVAVCVETRGNAYVHKVKARGQVVALFLIDPDIVTVRRNDSGVLVYRIGGRSGTVEMTRSEVLHVRGPTFKGGDIGMTPLQADAVVNSSLNAYTHEAAFFKNSASLPFAITVPGDINRDKAARILAVFKDSHAGAYNAGNPPILGAGSDIKPLGLTMADAQYVEGAKLRAEDIARIFRIPRAVINAGERGENIEQETRRFLTFGMHPRLERIESALASDPDFFAGTDLYPEFCDEDIIQVDAATRASVRHQDVQSGVLLPDEARAEMGRPPLPDGLGMVPQITPVGGAPNPTVAAATDSSASNGNGSTAD